VCVNLHYVDMKYNENRADTQSHTSPEISGIMAALNFHAFCPKFETAGEVMAHLTYTRKRYNSCKPLRDRMVTTRVREDVMGCYTPFLFICSIALSISTIILCPPSFRSPFPIPCRCLLKNLLLFHR